MANMILSRDGKETGVILSSSTRYCAACQRVSPCFVVVWPDGNKTKPCKAGVRVLDNGDLQIN